MPSDQTKNTALLFMTIAILGGVTGVYLHDKNIRLMPAMQTTLDYPAQAWDATKQHTFNLAAMSFATLETIKPKAVNFTGIDFSNVSFSNIEAVTIVRRIRYMRKVEGLNISSVIQNLGEYWSNAYTNSGLVLHYMISGTSDTLHSWSGAVGTQTQKALSIPAQIHDYSFQKASSLTKSISDTTINGYLSAKTAVQHALGGAADLVQNAYTETGAALGSLYNGVKRAVLGFHTSSVSGTHKAINKLAALPEVMTVNLKKSKDFEFKNILSYEPAAGQEEPVEIAEAITDKMFEDESGMREPSDPPAPEYKYAMEEKTLDIEGVLVPQSTTVISSSRDGQIAKINFDNGDMFQKGDILVEYNCEDLKAEFEAAEAEKELTGKRSMRNNKLFKLDIISDIEDLGFKTEDIKASAQAKIIEHRMEQCFIRAAYDGRVTNRLANEHEYTRTDRVLMEVASLDDLEVEFLVPSIWLRWVNVDAPISIAVSETGDVYDAIIKRIYGEIDPVSQSIQMSAKLQPYSSPLLPGMSGTITLDVTRIRDAGIKGFLEQPRYAGTGKPAE